MDDALAPRFAGRVGERWVIRYRLPDGSATDTTGWLEEVRPSAIGLRTRAGVEVRVASSAVVAAKRVSLAYGGRDPVRALPEEVQQVAARAWVADWEPLGAWTLRAGGGFTGRANSCLAAGDPGLPLSEAADRVRAYAARHGIEPRVQVVADSELEQGFRELGWVETYVRTAVLVTRLSTWLGEEAPNGRVLVTETWGSQWEAAYHRSRPNAADPARVRRILTSSPPRAFGSLARGGEVVAIGRGQVSGDWLGLAAVWTDPGHRRRGHATAVLRALGAWSARLGARSAYVQVEAGNQPAIGAYGRLGFVPHHHYLYLTPSSGATPSR